MSRRGAQHPTPGLPAVNLLSPADFERRAVHRLRRRFLVAGSVLVVLVLTLAATQQVRVRGAQRDVEAASEHTRRLTASVAELKPVQTYVAGVRAQVDTAQESMKAEIYFSDVFTGVGRALPSGSRLTSLTVTLAEPHEATAEVQATESACPGPDPFNTLVVVGCVAIAGVAQTRADVGDLVVALGEDDLFVEPFITTTTFEDGTQVTFSGSVGLSTEVFSGRYADLAAELLPEEAK